MPRAAIKPASGHAVQGDQAVHQHCIGHQPDPRHKGAEHHPLRLGRQRAEQGQGVQRRPHALADRPQVVEDEHPVHAGGLGPAGHLDRSLGVVAELREGDPVQPGALISGPWPAKSRMNSARRGSDVDWRRSWRPQAVATTGAGKPESQGDTRM